MLVWVSNHASKNQLLFEDPPELRDADQSQDADAALHVARTLWELAATPVTEASGMAALESLFGRGVRAAVLTRTRIAGLSEDPKLRLLELTGFDAGSAPNAVIEVRGAIGTWPARLSRRWAHRLGQYEHHPLRAYWTLRRGSGGWRLWRVEPDAVGAYHRGHTAAQSLEQEISDSAVIEASRESWPAAVPIEIAESLPRDPAAAAEEMALIDGRFSPQVIGACVGRIVRAWAAASEQEESTLAGFATPAGTRRLLHPPGWALRGPTVRKVTLLRLHPVRLPPSAGVEIEVWAWHGPRDAAAIERPDLGGSRRYLRWSLVLSEDPTQPWLFDEKERGSA
jgi:hypothetical protein